jgi:hypothetical protein
MSSNNHISASYGSNFVTHYKHNQNVPDTDSTGYGSNAAAYIGNTQNVSNFDAGPTGYGSIATYNWDDPGMTSTSPISTGYSSDIGSHRQYPSSISNTSPTSTDNDSNVVTYHGHNQKVPNNDSTGYSFYCGSQKQNHTSVS